MGSEESVESEVGRRRSQEIHREHRRRRRPNISGAKHKVEVWVSAAEFKALTEAAAEAGSSLPWYLVRCALHPAPVKAGRAWLSWPKRQALAAVLMNAVGALDEVRLQHLGRMGSNLTQIARAVNITGVLEEDIEDLVAELNEAARDLRERAERIEETANEVGRR